MSGLQSLFVLQESSTDVRWHKDKKMKIEDVLRHPSDEEGWKHFDYKFPNFVSDPRYVRLVLTLNGFNSFSPMSTSYKM